MSARDSWLWEHYLNAADVHEQQHAVYRSKAVRMAPVLAKGSTRDAIDYLIHNWHCDACGACSMSQFPEHRHDFILDQVKTVHAIMEEDAMERMCRD